MVRALAALALVVLAFGSADAAPKRRVKITTQPAGATVYLGAVEDGPVCEATPCSIEVPPGDHALVIDLKDHRRIYEGISVPKRGRVPDYAFTLEQALAVIIVEQPAGAIVLVDDVDSGKVPARIEVSAESHHVVVQLRGKTLFDEYVEVAAGDEKTIEPSSRGGGGEDGDDPLAGGDDDDDGDAGGITKSAGAARGADRLLSLTVAFDVGFRQFAYVNNQTRQELRDESEGGQILLGPVLEVWPAARSGMRFLRGLSLLGRYQYGVNKQAVNATGLTMKTNTFWQSMEVSVRYRWTFAQKATIEAGGGWVRDQYQFEGVEADVSRVPDVDYKAIRLGVRGSLLFPTATGVVEPYLSGENRIVSSGGKLQARFESANATGLRGALGLNIRRGFLFGGVEASATRYSWDFTFDPNAMRRAEGATDTIFKIALAVGAAY